MRGDTMDEMELIASEARGKNVPWGLLYDLELFLGKTLDSNSKLDRPQDERERQYLLKELRGIIG